MSRALLRGAVVALSLAAAARGEDDVQYTRDVQPLLAARCAGCHRPDKSKGRLDLTTYAALARGGRSGAVFVPGDPEQSLLVELVRSHDGEAPEMPEDGDPLSEDEVRLLEQWIRAGAVDDTPQQQQVEGPLAPRPYAHAPVVRALDHAPDGALLAVGGVREVLLVDAATHALAARLAGGAERVEALAFSPDGARLALVGGTPGETGLLWVWDVRERRIDLSVPLTSDCLFGVCWSPAGDSLAFGAVDALRIVDARTGEVTLFSAAHEDWVLDTAFSVDGSHVVSVSRDRSLKLVKVETQQFIDNITSITPGALKGGLMSVACHPTRDELLVGGADGTPKVYRTFREQKRVIGDDFNLLRSFGTLQGRVYEVAWGPGGDPAWVVAVASHAGASAGGEVASWSTSDGAQRWSRATPGGLFAASVAPDGRSVAVGGLEGRVLVLDADDGHTVADFVPFPLADPDVVPTPPTTPAPDTIQDAGAPAPPLPTRSPR